MSSRKNLGQNADLDLAADGLRPQKFEQAESPNIDDDKHDIPAAALIVFELRMREMRRGLVDVGRGTALKLQVFGCVISGNHLRISRPRHASGTPALSLEAELAHMLRQVCLMCRR
jgi:hypothetical protein